MSSKRIKRASICPHCGGLLTAERNIAHLRLFFKEIALVFENWPENHPEFKPSNTEQLRSWLLIKAGHCMSLDNVLEINDASNLEAMLQFVNASMTAIAQSGSYGLIQEHAGRLCTMVAKSIAADALTETEFRVVHDRVKDIYTREGFDVEAMLKHDA
jgi:hypothetical protein